MIDELIVVAHRDARSVREIAANVTVLTRADLDEELSATIQDVFRYTPGIDYEGAGNRFGAEGVNIRGIGGNRVEIVVDGVPLPDHFTVGSFSNATRDFLEAGLVRDIEVLHGPASALYGSSAIGGVVAVRTPRPDDVLRGGAFGGDAAAAWRGSDDSRRIRGIVAARNGPVSFLVGGSWSDGEQLDAAGVDEELDLRNVTRRSAIAKMIADDPLGNTLVASVNYQAAHTRSDLNSLLGSGRYVSTTALEGDDRYELGIAALSYEFGGGFVDAGVVRMFLEDGDVEQTTLDERAAAATPVSIDRYFAIDQRIRGIDVNLWKNFATANIGHRLGFGIELHEQRTEEIRDARQTDLLSGAQTNVLLGEVFPLRDFPVSRTSEYAAYLEDTISIGDWTFIAALRADRYKLSPQDDPVYAEDYPFAEPVSLEESDLSPKLGVVYRAGRETEIYAQYSSGFRAPPYADANIGLEIPLFNYRAVPNPDLRSETSDAIDVGMRWRRERASAHVSLFHTRYDDFIETRVRIGTDPVSGRTLFQSLNIDEARIEGIEAGFSLPLGDSFLLDVSGYYARGENDENGEPLNSVGPPQGVIGLEWRSLSGNSRLRLSMRVAGAWTERDETAGELYEPPGYAVMDLFATQRFGRAFVVHAGLFNLTDRVYWQWSDVRGLGPDDPLLPYLAQAGRSAGVSVNFEW